MATATQTSKILSAEQEAKLRQPIDEYVGKIQAQIDELRTDGTEKAVNIQNELDNLKRDRIYTAQEKTERETKLFLLGLYLFLLAAGHHRLFESPL